MSPEPDQLLHHLASACEALDEARQRYCGLRLLETAHGQFHPEVPDLATSIRDMERRVHALRRAVSFAMVAVPVGEESYPEASEEIDDGPRSVP